MPRFYLSPLPTSQANYPLPDTISRHIQVLRLQPNDSLTLFDGKGNTAQAIINSISRKTVSVHIEAAQHQPNHAPLELTLIQAISSSDKMDYTLQKSTELGISHIIPVHTERSQRLNAERSEKKWQRWQDIIIAACEQCGQNHLPTLEPIMPLTESFVRLKPEASKLLLSPHQAQGLKSLKPANQAVLLIGAEGGLSAAEEAAARTHGFCAITLGPRILRTETASLAALSALQTLWGDFG